jgi:hypothetical protein
MKKDEETGKEEEEGNVYEEKQRFNNPRNVELDNAGGKRLPDPLPPSCLI